MHFAKTLHVIHHTVHVIRHEMPLAVDNSPIMSLKSGALEKFKKFVSFDLRFLNFYAAQQILSSLLRNAVAAILASCTSPHAFLTVCRQLRMLLFVEPHICWNFSSDNG